MGNARSSYGETNSLTSGVRRNRFLFTTNATMVSVFSAGFVLATIVVAVNSCQLLVPAELLNGCIFDALAITVPSTGFSITRETCNEAVAKSVFQEQPYVYFANANEVGLRG